MSDFVSVTFTRRRFNPISWAIRWGMPRSRFALALSSHAIVDFGDVCYEATMTHGVRKSPRDVALHGQTIVCQAHYQVADRDAALAWAESQLCAYQPAAPAWMGARVGAAYRAAQLILNSNYDWGGAIGLGLAPDRDWAEAGKWFCYEFAAAALRAAGGPKFGKVSHIGETALLAVAEA